MWRKQTKSKYLNTKLDTPDGIFDSKKEYNRWLELKLMQRAGEIRDLQRQVKFVLIPSQRVNKRVVERECAYNADFVYIDKQGNKIVEDVKSPVTRTKEYIIKRKLMLFRFGIRIIEI